MHLGLEKINVFQWLKFYQPKIEQWKSQDLKVERVCLKNISADPVKHRIQVSIESKAHFPRLAGYGEDDNPLFAYEKALCELAERECLVENDLKIRKNTSNGLSAHRFKFVAKDNAINELIERDAFLRHWITKTPFLKVPDFNETPVFRRAIGDGFDIRLGMTFLGVKPAIVAFIVDKKTHGFVIGSSVQSNLRKASRKAIGEAFYSFAAFDATKANWDIPSLSNHRSYWRHDRSYPPWLFEQPKAIQLRLPKVVAQPKAEYVVNKEIHVAAAYCDQLMDLWVGETPRELIKYVADFYNVEANCEPHPFP